MHASILKRVGGVLLAVGLIDIAVMIYCVANHISYWSSFNIFSVVAGIFLLRGSLRAASLIRRFAVFILAGVLSLLIALPFLQPLDLTLTQLRLDPVTFLGAVVIGAFALCLLFWVSRELGRQPIQAAFASAGIKRRDMRIPAAAGVGLDRSHSSGNPARRSPTFAVLSRSAQYRAFLIAGMLARH